MNTQETKDDLVRDHPADTRVPGEAPFTIIKSINMPRNRAYSGSFVGGKGHLVANSVQVSKEC